LAASGQNLFTSSAQKSYWHTLKWNLNQEGGGWYVRFGGTSGSAPIVVGAVALMLQMQPTLTADQVRQVLQSTAVSDSFTGVTPNPSWGYGKLNVLAALDALSP
jgi:subtilisin family serine protease